MRHENDHTLISSATIDAAIESVRRLHLLAVALDGRTPRGASRAALRRKVLAAQVQLVGAGADKTETGRSRRCNLAGVRLAESYALALSLLDQAGEASEELTAVLSASNELADLLGVTLPQALPVTVGAQPAGPATSAAAPPASGVHDEEVAERVNLGPVVDGGGEVHGPQPVVPRASVGPMHVLDPPASVGHT